MMASLNQSQQSAAAEAVDRSQKVPVSILIPSRNEERNIVECLKSVLWADECVLVDSGSTDRTCTLARDMGATVVPFSWSPGSPKKKNWALENYQFRNDWILILDADERITPELATEIATVISDSNLSGYYINRRFFFLGKWIRHAGYFPSWNMRLLRRGQARYEFVADYSAVTGDNEVHEHVILNGTAGKLKEPMDHYAFPDVFTFLEKHNRYSTWEAACEGATQTFANNSDHDESSQIDIKRSLKRVARSIPFPHWGRFFYHYFLKLGFLDGVRGYYFCHLLAEYEFQISAKRYELKVLKRR